MKNPSELWFDDNHENIYLIVYPILKRRKMTGCLGIVVDWVNCSSYMSIEQIITLIDEGWIVGSHSLSHRDMRTITLREAEMDMKSSKFWIETILGYTPDVFVFPYNSRTLELENIALKYYEKIRADDSYLFHCKDWVITPNNLKEEIITQNKTLPARERTASRFELESFKKLIEKRKIMAQEKIL